MGKPVLTYCSRPVTPTDDGLILYPYQAEIMDITSTVPAALTKAVSKENYSGRFANDLNYVELRIAGVTPPKDLAGSIAFKLEQGMNVALVAIGHQAVGQAIKAIPILNGMTIAHGYVIAV